MKAHKTNSQKSRSPSMTDWGTVAKWYDNLIGESGSEYHREVVLPGVMRMLAPQTGESAVDIACGQGVLCRMLQERGVEITGIDAAKELIDAARERGPQNIRYFVGDARDLKFLASWQFNCAACVLAIQNINPIQPVFAEVSRILKPMGRF